MLRISLLIILFLCMLTNLQAATKKNQYAWQEIPNTTLKSACPEKGHNRVDYDFNFYCQNVTAAWNGGAFDSKRNRLYIWGGGHTDYMGNEIYALDLNQNTMLRLTSPASPLADSMPDQNPSELMPYDGSQPNSRHTYDAMVYLPNEDRLWVFSGSLASAGGTDSVTWIFNPNNNRWKRVSPKGTLPKGNYGIVSAYNPNTGSVILHDQRGLYSYRYTPEGGIYSRLVEDRDYGIHLSGEFDPERNVFVMIGGEQEYLYDLKPGNPVVRKKLKTTGDREIINSQGPGFAYHPQLKQMIAWAGGNKVYALDLDKKTWTAIPNTGDPGPAICNGTYGRWAYSSQSQAFVTYNWYENNAFLLKLTTQKSGSAQLTPTASSSFNPKKAKTDNKQTNNSQAHNSADTSTISQQTSANNNAAKLVVTPSADTYLGIYQNNTGKQPYLELSTNLITLVKFAGSEFNQNTQIKRAILRMYQKNSQSMPPIYAGVFLSNTDWQEDSNWQYANTAKKIQWIRSTGDWQDRSGIIQGGQPFDLQQVIVKPKGQWLEWDVTELIQRWQAENHTSSLGIVIRSLSGQQQPIQFYSREYEDVALRPHLVIESNI